MLSHRVPHRALSSAAFLCRSELRTGATYSIVYDGERSGARRYLSGFEDVSISRLITLRCKVKFGCGAFPEELAKEIGFRMICFLKGVLEGNQIQMFPKEMR
jgi:hypothetical protein